MEHKIISFELRMPGNKENIVHPVLLWDEEDIILVDCGFIGSFGNIERELAAFGLKVEDLTGLLITHHDHDHMGAAAAVKRANPGIKIYASALEEPYISSREKPLRLRQAEELQKFIPPEKQEFGRAFCKMLRSVEPVEVDILLTDGDFFPWCGGSTVLLTPGHTPGHISLYIKELDAVITGDAFAVENKKPVIANPQFTLDLKRAEESKEKLLSLNAKVYYSYHGGTYAPSNKIG